MRRSLSWFSLFSVSFSIMSITTGIFLNFAFGITELGPVSIWIWPVVGVGQLLVALVLSELGTRIPLAGASYQWGSRLIGPVYGWFIGALGILYGAVGVPGIVYLAVAPLTEVVHGLPKIEDGEVWFCSDEHTTFKPLAGAPPAVGDLIRVLPAHVDPTVALHDTLHLVDGEQVVDQWPVDMRGWR